MISPSHSGAPHGRLHSQNEHSDPRIHLNIKRMLTVISDASSIEMYDRHAVILDYLAKSLVRDHNSPSDSDIPLLFDLNGKDETSNFCRIMVEAHQRALEGGGLQLTCPLINLITLIW